MTTLSNELKAVIVKRLENAGSDEVLTIASALCEAETAPVFTFSEKPAYRFEVRSDVVVDLSTGLTWSKENVAGGRMNWKAAQEACAKITLGGYSDWRLPTIAELLTLVDYQRTEPAINPAFTCEVAAYWTSTPAASSPGVCAWCVDFDSGGSGWYSQSFECFVRAVRASQS